MGARAQTGGQGDTAAIAGPKRVAQEAVYVASRAQPGRSSPVTCRERIVLSEQRSSLSGDPLANFVIRKAQEKGVPLVLEQLQSVEAECWRCRQ